MNNALHWCRGIIARLLILLLLTLKAHAATPAIHVTAKPDWLISYKPYDKRPSARSIQNGYYLALVERQIQVEKQADYRHTIREIVSDAGIQNGSQISVSFDPTFERVDFHDVTVWRGNKPLNRLDVSAFKVIADESDLSKFIYQGSYTALYILKDIRKGDRIEYSYTVTGRNPIFDDKFCRDIYMQGGQLFAHQCISLITSVQRKLTIKPFNNVPAPVIAEGNGFKTYAWESFQVPPVKDADGTPDWYNPYNYIQVSEYSSWADVVAWGLKINPAASHLTGDLKATVAKLKHESGKDKAKYFRKAVETVQDEIRYMGIETGEYSHRANRPERVYNQRYGDCKDKSLLLVSMLRADSIDASLVLINAANGYVLDQFLPSNTIFDHAVVVATINGKQVFVDATISYQRGSGTDIYFPDYGKGLILKEGINSLTTVPPSVKGKEISREVYTIKNSKLPVRMDVKTVYTLNQADRMRDRLASSGMAETEKAYLDYYSKIYAKIEQRDSVNVVDDEKKNVLTTYESYTITDFLKKEKNTAKFYANTYANFIDVQLPSVNNQIKTPVAVGYPSDMDYTIKIVLPGGWDVTHKDTGIKRDAYRFSSAVSANKDTLSLHYEFAWLKSFVPSNQLDTLREDVKNMKDNLLSYSFSYTPPDAEAAAGTNSQTNVWMVVYAACLLIVLARLAVWIYHRETPGILFSPGSTFVAIGGWLILIIIGLALTAVFGLVTLANSDYFSLHSWNITKYGSTFKALIVTETTGNILLVCYAAFCLVLLVNRRDILPACIIGFYLFAVAFFTVDYIFAEELHLPTTAPGRTVLRSIIVAAIWISYFIKSERVKETFIVPYPPTNVSYEPAGESDLN